MSENPVIAAIQEVPVRTRKLAVAALSVIALLAALLYGIKPAYLEYQRTEEKALRAASSAVNRDLGAEAGLNRLRAEVEALREELVGDAGQVPREQIESFVVGTLDRISQRHGVQLVSIQPSETASVWMFEELPYSVSVTGSYFSLHQWLYEVEEDLRPMVVKSFEMRPSRPEGRVQLDLRVVAYRATPGTDV